MRDATSVQNPLLRRQVTRREARVGWLPLNGGELWQYRELLWFYAARDIKVKYRQTLLGVVWAVLQPILAVAVFSLFLGRLQGISPAGVPYPVYTMCALLPWQLFAFALTQSSSSLVQDADVLRKVYFPRLLLPMASVVAGLVDFVIAFAVLLAVMAYYGVLHASPALVALPALIVLVLLSALAVGILLSAINVKYRDVRHVMPFLSQLWFFATPVAYSTSLVDDRWRTLYGLNPMVGVIGGFRWALLDQPPPSLDTMAASIAATVVLLFVSLLYFRRVEHGFADII